MPERKITLKPEHMGKTKQLLEEYSWEQLDKEMEDYFLTQEAKFFQQRNETLNQLNKE